MRPLAASRRLHLLPETVVERGLDVEVLRRAIVKRRLAAERVAPGRLEGEAARLHSRPDPLAEALVVVGVHLPNAAEDVTPGPKARYGVVVTLLGLGGARALHTLLGGRPVAALRPAVAVGGEAAAVLHVKAGVVGLGERAPEERHGIAVHAGRRRAGELDGDGGALRAGRALVTALAINVLTGSLIVTSHRWPISSTITSVLKVH